MSNGNGIVRVFVQAPSGERFEADIPRDVKLSKLAADFFEARGWPLQDRRGRGQRAVVELVDPHDPENTKRLNGDLDVEDAGIQEGDPLRIFPESIAGAVDQRARLTALIADQKDMEALSARNPRITFTANRSHAPDCYEITLHYSSFVEWYTGMAQPRRAEQHEIEIILGADYPRRAPIVRWRTPIFHPNIRQTDGAVCLGALGDSYLPGLGLARLVQMLAEMAQWRNFDAYSAFNQRAAEWAADMDNWPYIEEIGGHPLQGPVEQLIDMFNRIQRKPITFRRVAADT